MSAVTVTHPQNRNVERGLCPATFDAEPYTKASLSSYEVPVADASGQQPRLSEQLAVLGVPLTKAQWEQLDAMERLLPKPWNWAWEPTWERVTLGLDGKPIDANDPEQVKAATVEHQVADCPTCGSPIKID